MARKKKKETVEKKDDSLDPVKYQPSLDFGSNLSKPVAPGKDPMANLPKEAQEKLKGIKDKLDKFQKRVVEKFDKYIAGIALAPPPKPQDPKNIPPGLPPDQVAKIQEDIKKKQEQFDPNRINAIVLVDDSDSKKMSKAELKQKLATIIDGIAQDIDKNLYTQTIILSELWQNCYDAKYDLLQLIALSAPVYDKGMLAAIKISEVHKTMVLKKFEKYIVSYVLAGSLVQGRATKTSDIDVWIVIDDTDVKKMTRLELKDKLRAIIIGMGIEAGEITKVKNKINIQVYILTDFWDSLKEANPVIFTLLRDGVPFFDRGIFMPWKQLLKMGKIKPSPEAIDIFMGSGEQVLKRAEAKLKEIGMEDIYYALLTPSQAALMLYGVAPPAPKETANLMKEVFVKKEKLLEEKFVKTLETSIDVRKRIEHGEKKELTGKEVDELLANADKYLKRIKRLFTQIEKIREEKDVVTVYDTVSTMTRDVLRLEGGDNIPDTKLQESFKDKLVKTGKIPSKFSDILDDVIKNKKDYDAKKLSKLDVSKFQKDSQSYIRFMLEHVQRKRGRELERAKIRVKHGKKYGEVLLLDSHAYIIHDVDAKDKEIGKAPIKDNGSLGQISKSSPQDLEKAIIDLKMPKRAFIKEPIFEDLKKIFGPDVEVLIGY